MQMKPSQQPLLRPTGERYESFTLCRPDAPRLIHRTTLWRNTVRLTQGRAAARNGWPLSTQFSMTSQCGRAMTLEPLGMFFGLVVLVGLPLFPLLRVDGALICVAEILAAVAAVNWLPKQWLKLPLNRYLAERLLGTPLRERIKHTLDQSERSGQILVLPYVLHDAYDAFADQMDETGEAWKRRELTERFFTEALPVIPMAQRLRGRNLDWEERMALADDVKDRANQLRDSFLPNADARQPTPDKTT